jgi:hypothetical protein
MNRLSAGRQGPQNNTAAMIVSRNSEVVSEH